MSNNKREVEIDQERLQSLVAEYSTQRWPLIPLLHKIQDEFGFIPPESIPHIAHELKLYPSEVQGVISFYAQLYTEPRGRKTVRVCRGTACHVRGGKTILKLVKQYLGIDEGETTEDLEYTLETVACIGVCALAPSLVIDQHVHGKMNPKKLEQLFKQEGEQHEST